MLVVINKIDEHQFGLNEPELKREYENIKGFYHISCKNGEGIELFKQQLRTHRTGRNDRDRMAETLGKSKGANRQDAQGLYSILRI